MLDIEDMKETKGKNDKIRSIMEMVAVQMKLARFLISLFAMCV